MAIGDSFTFGMGVADDEAWPARLQTHLNEKAEVPFSVTNAGVISYGVSQVLDLLNEHLQSLQPRVVIHGLYWNDYMVSGPTGPNAASALTEEGYFVWDVPPRDAGLARIKVWLRDHSLLVYLGSNLAEHLLGVVTDSGVTDYEVAYRSLVRGDLEQERWMPVEDFYRQLKATGETDGFEVYSIIMPVLGILESGEGASHPYAKQMRALLEHLGIRYLDGVGLWQQRGLSTETFLPYNRHLNAAGYEVLADAIWEDIADIAR